MPEKPLASTLARSAIDARTARTGSGSSTPAAWLRSRLTCSWARSSRCDARLGERAEAGVDAVDRRVALGAAVDHRARGDDARPRLGRQPHLRAVVGDGDELVERQIVAGEREHLTIIGRGTREDHAPSANAVGTRTDRGGPNEWPLPIHFKVFCGTHEHRRARRAVG